MSFSFGFEDDDDIEATEAEMRDAQPIAASTKTSQNGAQIVPAAETARSHKVQDLVRTVLPIAPRKDVLTISRAIVTQPAVQDLILFD